MRTGPTDIKEECEWLRRWVDGKWEIFIILFFTIIPTVWPIILLAVTIKVNDSLLENFVLCTYLVLIIALICLGVLLLFFTEEPSISGMVAQRYNRVSYLAILVITALSFFTMCFIVLNGIARANSTQPGAQPAEDPVWILLASLSPFVSWMILLFPIVVHHKADHLMFTPFGHEREKQAEKHILCLLIPGAKESQWTIRFYRFCSTGCHILFHVGAISGGLALGYTSLLHAQLADHNVSRFWYLLISIVSVFFFFLLTVIGNVEVIVLRYDKLMKNKWYKRLTLWFEYTGLYFYMLALIYTAISPPGGLIKTGF